MYNPQTQSHFPLALPGTYQHLSRPQSAAAASASTSYAQSSDPPPKKRKINSNAFHRPTHDDRELDERDDVADDDLVAAPVVSGVRGGIDENYDEEEEAEVEGEGDAEEEGLEQGVIRGEEEGASAVGASGKGGKKKAGVEGLDVNAIKAKGHIMKGNQIALRDLLDPEAAKRFDTFSSVVIPKQAMKRLNRDIYDQGCPDNTAMLLAGMAKIFVAEVIEIAKDIQPHTKFPTGPLKPYHLRLARQVLEERGMVEASTSRDASLFKPRKSIFRR